MKYVMLSAFGVLVLASLLTWQSMPGVGSDVPVLYWVTDSNPARGLQIKTFHEWLAKNNYPKFELRVDTANADFSKRLIQSVSGVASDVLDHTGGGTMYFFQEMSLLEDVTEWGQELDFGPDQTYPAIVPEITVDGRQFAFPSNVFAHMYWANKATFRKYGMDTPPDRWTFEEFERIGKELVKKANEGKKRQDVFFVDSINTRSMMRSVGADVFNETLTRCAIDDPRAIEALELSMKWMNEDHIVPSSAERDSFSTSSGYGGSTLQLFNSGNYAMFGMGRYALIQLRDFGRLELSVSEPPHGGLPNTNTGTRASAIFVGGKHKELAKYFLSYLASEDYNMNIVMDADALPPNPKYTKMEEYLRPKDYPNEWGCHEAFSKALAEIAISDSDSPFVQRNRAYDIVWQMEDKLKNDRCTAAEAVREMADRINERIDLVLENKPSLRPLYEKRSELQKQIEEHRKNGKKVPLNWISNPFHRKYYVFKGWAE